MSGLTTVVEGAALSRLAGNNGSYQSTSDLSANANNIFTYERYSSGLTESTASPMARYRVIQEVAAGSGCSSCSSGFGTTSLSYPTTTVPHPADPYDYSSSGIAYNTWSMRTKEYLPDSTDGTLADNDYNIVYTNERGQIMLKVQVDANRTTSSSDDKMYPTYYHYDANGYNDYIVHPSALKRFSNSGWDNWENYSDLVNWEQTISNVLPSRGLVEHFVYGTTLSATSSTAGDVVGNLKSYGVQNGHTSSSTDTVQYTQDYIQHSLNRTLSPGDLTSSGTTATVTWTNHDFAVGEHISITGASQTLYNGSFTIDSITQDTLPTSSTPRPRRPPAARSSSPTPIRASTPLSTKCRSTM
jgi:hypothetical protein